MNTHMILVCTTVGTEEAAQSLARLVVTQRLAACVHMERIHSTYRWQGELQEEPEYRLLAKTTPERAEAVHAAWAAAHPYEVPAIWTVQAQALSPGFAAWLAQETDGLDAGADGPKTKGRPLA